MNKNLKKGLLVVPDCIIIVFVLTYLGFYLSGVWKIEVGDLNMRFDNPLNAYMVLAWGSIYACHQAKEHLPESDDRLRRELKKKRRVLYMASFILYGFIYFLGQSHDWHTPYEYLGPLSLVDLGIVYLVFVLSIANANPLPKKSSTKHQKASH